MKFWLDIKRTAAQFLTPIALSVFVWTTVLQAQDIAVPFTVQADLLLKVLKFDRAIIKQDDQKITIAILFQPKNSESTQAKEQIEGSFKSLMPMKVGGFDIRFVAIEYRNSGSLEESIKSSRIDIIYITPLRSVKLADILAVTARLKVLTQTGVPDYVRQGVSVGIGIKDNKPEILINQSSSVAEGAEFSSQLLRIATLFDKISH